MDSDVFSEGELEFQKHVAQFIKAVEAQPSGHRAQLFTRGAKALHDIFALAPNPPISPTTTGTPGSGGASPSTGSARTTQGTCPKCTYVFNIT